MTTGFANGCFDLLHEGHLHLLKFAAARCSKLIVAINDDDSIRRLKGPGRPIETLEQRMQALVATRLIDTIVPFCLEIELALLIAGIEPDVMFKGMDYDGKPIVGEHNAKAVVLVDLLPGHSTTALIERMKR